MDLDLQMLISEWRMNSRFVDFGRWRGLCPLLIGYGNGQCDHADDVNVYMDYFGNLRMNPMTLYRGNWILQ